nr:hypothetical protein [Tanacetum cinerariifolium]
RSRYSLRRQPNTQLGKFLPPPSNGFVVALLLDPLHRPRKRQPSFFGGSFPLRFAVDFCRSEIVVRLFTRKKNCCLIRSLPIHGYLVDVNHHHRSGPTSF